MEELLHLIQTRRAFLFTELFDGRPVTVRVLVATFIAVLELTRLRKLRVRQDEAYADIHVEAVDDPADLPGLLAAPALESTPEPESVSVAPAAIEMPLETPPEESTVTP
jgi:segregation and condensation protein A